MEEKTVLFVDDEKNILKSIQRLLIGEDFNVLTADNAETALDILSQVSVPVVVSDQTMPDISGIKFMQQVKSLYPDSVRVILSGHVDVDLIVDSVNKGEVYRFITKPWKDEELIITIRQCFEHYEIVRQNQVLSCQVSQQNEELKKMNERLSKEVDERTRYLQLSQEILDSLPVPVLGIDKELRLITTNNKARLLSPKISLSLPGTPVADLFPEGFCKLLQLELSNNPEQATLPALTIEGRKFTPSASILGNSYKKRGLVLLFNFA